MVKVCFFFLTSFYNVNLLPRQSLKYFVLCPFSGGGGVPSYVGGGNVEGVGRGRGLRTLTKTAHENVAVCVSGKFLA